MTEQQNSNPEDVEGHRLSPRPGADAEGAEGGDDVEGHRLSPRPGADAEGTEGDDDVEGHRMRQGG